MKDESWLEMDLYWFQGDKIEGRIAELFDRIAPLWAPHPAARKGLSVCVGWLFDSVLYWNGDIDADIVCCQAPKYEAWSYRQLGALVRLLHEEAQLRGIENFHVALPLMGIETQSFPESAGEGWGGRTEQVEHKASYDIEGKWFFEHPEVIDQRFGKFDFGAPIRVPADERIAPPRSKSFGDYFAAKLISMTAAVGFDAVLFRDHVFTKAYCRTPGGDRYLAPEARTDLNAGILRFFRSLKQANPKLITIGYSSGASSMEEWRSHGFDLEALGNSGCLDLWITQTWGSAWQDYWPMAGLGFTFQLANVLIHAAMLAKTPTKHLFLIETFDAWEPWDSIHEYPSKVAWEVWAYSHAAVLLPQGATRMTAGYYLSWLHRRQELLPQKTVSKVARWLADAESHLARHPVAGGPCLVYDRKAFASSLAAPDPSSRGEEIDDLTAMLMKFSTPAAAICRQEDLEAVEADGWIMHAESLAHGVSPDWVIDEAENGRRVLLVGRAAEMAAVTRSRLGIVARESPVRSSGLVPVSIVNQAATLTQAGGGAWFQQYRSLAPCAEWTAFLEALGGPVFAKHRALPIWFWEPPEWGDLTMMNVCSRTVGSPEPWQAVALSFAHAGWGMPAIGMEADDLSKPVSFHFWRCPDEETVRFLIANLETGLTGSSQFCARARLSGVRSPAFDADFSPVKWRQAGHLEVTLLPHGMSRGEAFSNGTEQVGTVPTANKVA